MAKVLIAGTFDIIHPGHINLLKQAKKFGNFIVAVIARDQNVIKTKAHAPYFNEKRRFENLKNLCLAEKVVLGDLVDPYRIIQEEKPDIVAFGYDQMTFVDGLNQLKTQNLVSGAEWLKFNTVRLKPFKEDFCKGKNIRKAVEDSEAGFLLINKPMDWTSHDVVAKLRSITKIKQIGHTGTLDPFAIGLLVCAVGNATKMAGLFDLLPKTYEAQIKIGAMSDTYDRTGKILNSKLIAQNKPKIRITEIQKILLSFLGRQKQLPPMYSAKKVQGEKLYNLARKGIEIERLPSRIEIYYIKLLGFKNDVFDIEIKCSAGTYIRTLAYDIGQKLGCGAVLWELNRTNIGNFSLNKAVKLEQLNQSNWRNFSLPPLHVLGLINHDYLTGLDFTNK